MAANQLAGEAAHVAAQFGIPKGLFLGLVNQESGFNPSARSSAGAYGLTQLMPGTARGLGVDLSDPHSQLVGGAKYLKEQYQRFGNWRDALAAYNAGPGNVANGAWQHIPETQNYVKSILGSVGKFAGVQPQAPASTNVQAPQIPQPVLRGKQGLDVNAFAADEFSHLGDPGYALKGLALGQYEAPAPQIAQPKFSDQLSALHSPQAPVDNSGFGQSLVKTALTQLGQPYQWGGSSAIGSHTDCSGLMQRIFAEHGISIPRTTYQQWRTGKPVPIAQLQAGDLVFFHSTDKGPGHVGMYVGGGRFINDPHTGASVRIDTLSSYPGFVGARRITGVNK